MPLCSAVARSRTTLLVLAALAAAPAVARAETFACHFEAGVVVVPAEAAGVVGDFILDTGTAQTTLDETRAASQGLAEAGQAGDVRVAGVEVTGTPLAVQDLDVRTWNLPTPAVGVIGMDVLRGFVLDLSFAPCRVALYPPGRAPAFRGTALAITWDEGLPTVPAAVSDGARELRGPFVVATGANVPVRLTDDLAQAPGLSRPNEVYPQGVWLARLEALTFAGVRQRGLGAGLMKPQGEIAGVIGGTALARFRLRFDFPAGRLMVAPGP
jgi:hypothetical protein